MPGARSARRPRPSTTTAAANPPRVAGACQPRSRRLDDRVDEHADRRRRPRATPGTSTPGASGSRDSGTSHERQPGGDDRERHQGEEHAAPPEVLEQQPAGDRADRDRDADDRAPDADRLGPFAALGEGVRDDRQRRREDHRREDAHHQPHRDQLAGARAERAEPAGRREPEQADDQGGPSTEAVAETAGRRAPTRRTPGCRRRRSTAARRVPAPSSRVSDGSATLTIVGVQVDGEGRQAARPAGRRSGAAGSTTSSAARRDVDTGHMADDDRPMLRVST